MILDAMTVASLCYTGILNIVCAKAHYRYKEELNERHKQEQVSGFHGVGPDVLSTCARGLGRDQEKEDGWCLLQQKSYPSQSHPSCVQQKKRGGSFLRPGVLSLVPEQEGTRKNKEALSPVPPLSPNPFHVQSKTGRHHTPHPQI